MQTAAQYVPKIVAGSLTFFLSNATAEEVQEAVKAGCEGLHGIGFLLSFWASCRFPEDIRHKGC